MNNIFYGLLFVFLDFNAPIGLSIVGLIPDFIGYILIFSGLAELSAGKDRFSRMRPFAVAMAAYTALLYASDVFGIYVITGTMIRFLLGLAAILMSLFMSYNIVAGIKELETSLEQSLNSRPLFYVWIISAALRLAAYGLILIPELNTVCIIASNAAGVAFLVLMNRTKNLYYGGK